MLHNAMQTVYVNWYAQKPFPAKPMITPILKRKCASPNARWQTIAAAHHSAATEVCVMYDGTVPNTVFVQLPSLPSVTAAQLARASSDSTWGCLGTRRH